jgi:hypothetical protein
MGNSITKVKDLIENLPYSAKTLNKIQLLEDFILNLEHIPEEEIENLVEKYRKVWSK